MQPQNNPNSVGIIIDGNRRWARERGLKPWEGHEAGYKKVKEVMLWVRDAGVKYVTAYTFSTENWKRPELEVTFLIKLIESVLGNEVEWARKEGIRLVGVGDLSPFSSQIQKLVHEAEEKTKDCSRITLGIALNYGGRAEIVQAVNEAIKIGKQVTEEELSKLLYTKDIPDPDLIMRTSGEQRLSGFLPWQSVYSELFFIKKFFPDLVKEDIDAVLKEFSERDIRRGK